MKRKLWSLLLCTVLLSGGLYGCGTGKISDSSACPYEETIVVDVFDSLANFQGIQSGWFAKIVKDKFNMELNIIAPNVSGGGETLFETRCAAGNLGDLIICTAENGTLEELISSNLIIDMSEYLSDKQIMRYKYTIDLLNDDLGENCIYAIPSEISLQSATTPAEGLDPTFGPYLRWDLYEQLGCPEIGTLEDLLPVLKQMQELYPETESGQKTYGFSFFSDWDGNLMNAAKQPCCFYGYDEFGFLLAKADGSDYQDIADSDSLYMRVLKLYFDANQLGLVDPESRTQNYDQFYQKYVDGSILYCPWPWLCQSAYNTTDHMNQGMGYMMSVIQDMQIFSYGCNPEGNQKTVICIGSNARDPERLADFIDWLYSPEGIMIGMAQEKDGTAGPQGLCWDMDENGEPYLTDFGTETFLNGGSVVPDEWGGGTWKDGISALNYKPISRLDLTPEGFPYYYALWDSVCSKNLSSLEESWQTYSGASNAVEYLREHDLLLVAPGTGYVAPRESSEITAIRSQCRNVITDYSWKMVFAEDEDEFYALMTEMQNKLHALGYEQVCENDLANAKAQNEARMAAAAAVLEQTE